MLQSKKRWGDLCSYATSFTSRQDFAFRIAITLQLISDDHARNVLQPIEKLAEKSFRGLLVTPTLDEDVEHITVLVHCSP